MPGVPTVVLRLLHDLGEPSFHQSLMGTLGRLGAGYGLALLPGIGFGLVAAVLYFFREVLRSALVILRSIPSVAWVPLFLIVLGCGSASLIVVVALAALFPAALSVMDATASVQRVHVSAARVMGATRWGLIKR